MRRAGERLLQTLKARGSTRGGLYERDEFEGPVSGDMPDLDALRALVPKDCALGKLIRNGDLDGRLAPIFTMRVQRAISLLRLPEGDEVELALDNGTIQAGETTTRFQEVEIEMKSGEPEHLYGFALDLLEAVPLQMSPLSKGERGYVLIAGEHHEPIHAQPLMLKRRDTVERSFQLIAQNCLAQIQGNERGVVSGDDSSNVHQMRVGLRRLRSALDLMESLIVCPSSLQEELKWITGELGGARDWEVLASSTLPEAFATAPEDADAATVRRAATEIAKQNRERAATAVGSARYARLMIELNRWLEQAGWREGMTDERHKALTAPIRKFANQALHSRHRKLIKRGRRLPDLDARRRHRARIAAKKLRYATEFFASLYPKRRVRNYATALRQLQDDLGWRNDVTVADALLSKLTTGRPETGIGAGYARGYLASRVAADHDALQALWKKFKRSSPPG
jgi:inorganic triphosphatase YgiF